MNHARGLLDILGADSVLAASTPKDPSPAEEDRLEAMIEYRCLDLACAYIKRHGLTVDPADLLEQARSLEDLEATDPAPC